MKDIDSPKIIQEGPSWVALDKPPHIIVHDVPGKTHAGNTLVDWLRAHVPEIGKNFPDDEARPGIVHRLDADTSGVILVAKNPNVLKQLQDQFRARTTKKIYQALVLGDPGERGRMTGAVLRKGGTQHAVKRLSFSWDKATTKPAETSFRRLEQFTNVQDMLSLVELNPRTGRTHQLRVQLLDHGTPIIGDQTYNTKQSREVSGRFNLDRQFLHAILLTFTDPESQQAITVTSQLAPDLQAVLDRLRYRT